MDATLRWKTQMNRDVTAMVTVEVRASPVTGTRTDWYTRCTHFIWASRVDSFMTHPSTNEAVHSHTHTHARTHISEDSDAHTAQNAKRENGPRTTDRITTANNIYTRNTHSASRAVRGRSCVG